MIPRAVAKSKITSCQNNHVGIPRTSAFTEPFSSTLPGLGAMMFGEIESILGINEATMQKALSHIKTPFLYVKGSTMPSMYDKIFW
jgi:hypothetical protein